MTPTKRPSARPRKRPKSPPLPKPYAALVDDLAARAGGEMAFAYKLGVTLYAVRQWRVRGLPEDRWLAVADLCGATVDDIWHAHRGRGTMAA